MRWVALALVLAGCGGAEPVEEPVVSFRDQSAPIASQVDVEIGEIQGGWTVRQAFAPMEIGTGVFVFEEGEVFATPPTETCPIELTCDAFPSVIANRYMTSGRWSSFAASDPHELLPIGLTERVGGFELWILWADADRRTMAIGTPDGSFGFILDRNATGGDDRIAAALDIMAWMGYRVDEMEGL